MVRAHSWFYISAAFVLSAAASTTPQVIISPSTTSVRAGATRHFTARLKNSSGVAVWAVNGTVGGSADVGTITDGGLYVAPLQDPGMPITVRATMGMPPIFAEA